MPRPWPLATTGRARASAQRRAASLGLVGLHVDLRTSTGRSAWTQDPLRHRASGSGSRVAGGPGIRQLGRPLREQRLKGDVEEHRAPVRLGGQAQRLVDLAGDGGDVADGAGVLGDGGDQRRVVEPRGCRCPSGRSARPPSTSTGEPLKWAVVTALIPLVTPGPAVRTASPAGAAWPWPAANTGCLLVADVD